MESRRTRSIGQSRKTPCDFLTCICKEINFFCSPSPDLRKAVAWNFRSKTDLDFTKSLGIDRSQVNDPNVRYHQFSAGLARPQNRTLLAGTWLVKDKAICYF